MTKLQHLLVLVSGLVVVGLMVPIGAASSSQGSSSLGEITWPESSNDTLSALASSGESLFDEETEIRTLGDRPIQSFEIERVNETATRISVQERGQEAQSFVQRHEPFAGEANGTLQVPPDMLQPTVEPRPDLREGSRDVLRAYGPPGSFALTDGSIAEKTEDLAEKIGFPVERRHVDVDSVAFPGLYSGQRACLEAEGGHCEISVDFSIDCEDCEVAAFLASASGDDLDRHLQGRGLALFDGSGELIAVTVSYNADLDESALMERANARDKAASEIVERGHRVQDRPAPEEAAVSLALSGGSVDIQQVRYQWTFGVYTNGSAEQDSDVRNAVVTQDAAQGTIISVSLRNQEAAGGGGGDEVISRETPVPSVFASLIVLGGLSYLQRRKG
jgi:hypothetical protein